MKTFKQLMEDLTPPGNYVSIGIENFPHVEWLKGAKNINPSNAHITLVYSKTTSIPPDEVFDVASESIKDGDSCDAVSLAKFDSQEDDNLCCLVLKVSSDSLTNCHERLLEFGLKHSYDEFSPHVTLAYDIPKDDADQYIKTVDPKNLGPLTLKGLKSTRIDKNWSSKLSA